MKSFQNYLESKKLNELAAKCVRERIPIVEFARWYEEEGQYLNESPLAGMVGGGLGGAYAGGKLGAGLGAWGGPLGMAAGGAIGAGLGATAGHYLNKWNQSQQKQGQQGQQNMHPSQEEAAKALETLKQHVPEDKAQWIDQVVNYLKTNSLTSPEQGQQQAQDPNNVGLKPVENTPRVQNGKNAVNSQIDPNATQY